MPFACSHQRGVAVVGFRALAAGVVLTGTLAWLPAPARAETLLSSEPSAPKVSAAGGALAWSTYDTAAKAWFLVIRRDGVQERAAVAPRSVPFDVDLGFDGSGALVASYSRCRTEPAFFAPTGRGCDLYVYDLAAGRERRLSGASTTDSSEYLPTLAGGRVAFARVYEQRRGAAGKRSYLYVRPLEGGSSVRLPGGTLNDDDRTGPTSMDLGAGRLAFAWDLHGSAPNRCDYGCSELRVDTLAGMKTIVELHGNGNMSGRYALTPTLLGNSVAYGLRCLGDCRADDNQFRSLALVSGARGALTAPAEIGGTASDTAQVIYVRCFPYQDTPADPTGCQVLLRDAVEYADPDTELAQSNALSPVSAYGGSIAYSVYDASSRSYRLALRDRDGVVTQPVVAPRAVPFDVDLGPDAGGRLVAAYSRCVTEPRRAALDGFPRWSTGRGCDLYRYDVAAGRESRITGASSSGSSEFLPSIWKGEIAFARVYERRTGSAGRLPYLYVHPLSGPGGSTRLPGGSRGVDGGPGPQALDHYGTRIAVVWEDQPTGTSNRSQLRLDTQGADHRVLDSVTSATGGARLLAPSFDGGKLWWISREVADTTTGRGRSTVTTYDLSDAARQTALGPDPLVAYAVSRVTSRNETLTFYARRDGEAMTLRAPAWQLARLLPGG